MRNDSSSYKPSSEHLERSRNNKFMGLTHQRDINSQSNMNAFERYSILFDGSTYRPDFMAAVLCLLMTLVLISGVKKSVKFNNYLNMFNLGVFIFIIIAALPLLSLKYWRTDYYNNYNVATTNYLNRSKSLQASGEKYERTSYRVPYQRGLVNNYEIESTNFNGHLNSKNLVKRQTIKSKFKKINNQLLNRLRREDKKKNSIRTRFENLINQRLKRSNHHEDKRRRNEHEHNIAGFGDDEEEDEDLSIVSKYFLLLIFFLLQ